MDALGMTVPLSVLIFGLVFFGADFVGNTIFENPDLVPLIRILSLSILIAPTANVFFDTTVGFNKIFYKTITQRILQNIAQLTVTVSLLLLGFEVVSAAWGWVSGAFLSLILGFYFMEKKIGPILFSNVNSKHHRKKILWFSAPLMLSGMIGTILGWADTGLLGYYMTDFEVGLYNTALPTAILILVPHKAIGSLAVTSFSELKERDEKSVERSLKTATYWIFSLVFPTFLIMLLFSEQVLNLLWGSQYSQASLALSILALGYLVDAMAGRIGSFLKSKGYTKYILYNNALALTLNLALNVVLIPIYGIIGAAIATACSTALTNLLMVLEGWKKESIISIPSKKLMKVIGVGLIPLMLVAGIDSVLFAETPFWFVFPAGILYYSLYVLAFLKVLGLGEEEKNVLRRIGEKSGFEEEVEIFINRFE